MSKNHKEIAVEAMGWIKGVGSIFFLGNSEEYTLGLLERASEGENLFPEKKRLYGVEAIQYARDHLVSEEEAKGVTTEVRELYYLRNGGGSFREAIERTTAASTTDAEDVRSSSDLELLRALYSARMRYFYRDVLVAKTTDEDAAMMKPERYAGVFIDVPSFKQKRREFDFLGQIFDRFIIMSDGLQAKKKNVTERRRVLVSTPLFMGKDDNMNLEFCLQTFDGRDWRTHFNGGAIFHKDSEQPFDQGWSLHT